MVTGRGRFRKQVEVVDGRLDVSVPGSARDESLRRGVPESGIVLPTLQARVTSTEKAEMLERRELRAVVEDLLRWVAVTERELSRLRRELTAR